MPVSKHVAAVEAMRQSMSPMDPRDQLIVVMVGHSQVCQAALAREVIIPALRAAGLRVSAWDGGMTGEPLENNDRDAHVVVHITSDGGAAKEALAGEAWA